MFTGIIEQVGVVMEQSRGRLKIMTELSASLKEGDSIAVNGVCLTVTEKTEKHFTADVSAETLSRTCLGELKKGDPVNLERAMPADGRFDGHIVTGHVDGVGLIRHIERRGKDTIIQVEIPPELMKFVVEKGSIAIDGISLTVAAISGNTIYVAIVPYTLSHTTLGHKIPGSRVNVEADILGKYVHRFLSSQQSEKTLKDFLEGRY